MADMFRVIFPPSLLIQIPDAKHLNRTKDNYYFSECGWVRKVGSGSV
jgi:hypothetical protein